jgi:hypothetical protein
MRVGSDPGHGYELVVGVFVYLAPMSTSISTSSFDLHLALLQPFFLQTVKMLTSLSLLSLVSFAIAQAPPLPAKGDNGEMGGIFGMGQTSLSGGLPKGISIGGFPNGPEFPKPGPRLTSE